MTTMRALSTFKTSLGDKEWNCHHSMLSGIRKSTNINEAILGRNCNRSVG